MNYLFCRKFIKTCWICPSKWWYTVYNLLFKWLHGNTENEFFTLSLIKWKMVNLSSGAVRTAFGTEKKIIK